MLQVGFEPAVSASERLQTHALDRAATGTGTCTLYRIIMLPVISYGCETRSLTLREERGLRVFENRVLRRTFGPKKDEVTREWRKLPNEELSDLYSSPNIIRVIKSRRMRWAVHVARMGERKGAYGVLVEKHDGKRPLGRPRS
jgi:hypothetical protein